MTFSLGTLLGYFALYVVVAWIIHYSLELTGSCDEEVRAGISICWPLAVPLTLLLVSIAGLGVLSEKAAQKTLRLAAARRCRRGEHDWTKWTGYLSDTELSRSCRVCGLVQTSKIKDLEDE